MYLNGLSVDQDIERGLTHYFITGRTNFVARYSVFLGKNTLFKELLEDPEANHLFDNAKLKAEAFIGENDLRKSKIKAVARSHKAISSKHESVQKTGRVRPVEEIGLYIFLVLLAINGFMRPLRIGIFIGTQWLYRTLRF